MPNRILREGILTSVAVNSLTPQAEVFYRRLMSIVDDYGRFDGLVPVIFGRLYALQTDRVRVADVERWIAECEKSGLVRTYSVAGKPYLTLGKLGAPRAKESKYPDPPEGDDCTCAQTRAYVPGSDSGAHSNSGAGARASPLPKNPVSRKPKSTIRDKLKAARGTQ